MAPFDLRVPFRLVALAVALASACTSFRDVDDPGPVAKKGTGGKGGVGGSGGIGGRDSGDAAASAGAAGLYNVSGFSGKDPWIGGSGGGGPGGVAGTWDGGAGNSAGAGGAVAVGGQAGAASTGGSGGAAMQACLEFNSWKMDFEKCQASCMLPQCGTVLENTDAQCAGAAHTVEENCDKQCPNDNKCYCDCTVAKASDCSTALGQGYLCLATNCAQDPNCNQP